MSVSYNIHILSSDILNLQCDHRLCIMDVSRPNVLLYLYNVKPYINVIYIRKEVALSYSLHKVLYIIYMFKIFVYMHVHCVDCE